MWLFLLSWGAIMRNKVIIVLAALITTIVVINLIQLTIGIYTGDVPTR